MILITTNYTMVDNYNPGIQQETMVDYFKVIVKGIHFHQLEKNTKLHFTNFKMLHYHH